MKKFLSFIIIIFIFVPLISYSADWPIFKGNIYFTGNNDEIIIKNNNLKWLFQADDRVFNPVVSDGRVYFVDQKANVYCVDEEYGKIIWKMNLREIPAKSKSSPKAAGKVKYPLVKNDTLFLSDPVSIYAVNKRNGDILWSMPGAILEDSARSRASVTVLDGIYADPVIQANNIFYGTRNMFVSRDIRDGHVNWKNENIKTYSGFPTYYDDLIFSQSMDYDKDTFTVHCLKAESGKEVWSRSIRKPVRIFPPVVYKERVYISSENTMYCLNLNTGNIIWSREYGNIITSSPGFTDRSIIFAIGNKDVLVTDTDTGNVIKTIENPPKSGPYFVTIRDQMYIAYNDYESIKDRQMAYGIMKAVDFGNDTTVWTYKTPFPGAVSQPAASNGIMFFPAGNYLYAIGTEYYTRIIEGGSGHAVLPGRNKVSEVQREQPRFDAEKLPVPKKIPTRKIELAVAGRDNRSMLSEVEIKKRDKDRIIYYDERRIDKSGIIEVPEGNNVELLITADGYMPKKEIVNETDKEKHVMLDKLETGKDFVVDNILFEIDKAYLKKESVDILDKLIKIMKARPDLQVEVRGHTDSIGTKEYNQKLSERRADAVTEFMIKNGISPGRLSSAGFGMTKPIDLNDTEEGRKKNRRTEFYFKK